MRPLRTLVAALSLVAASSPAAAGPGAIPVGRGIVPPASPLREKVSVYVTAPDDASDPVAIVLDVVYAPSASMPNEDSLVFTREAPSSFQAYSDDGHPLLTRVPATGASYGAMAFALPTNPAPRGVRVHMETPVPRIRRYGWRTAHAEIDVSTSAPNTVRNDIVTTVDLAVNAQLPGFSCGRTTLGSTCTRTSPRQLNMIPIVVPAPLDVPGSGLLLITLAASVYGFARMRRKRAAEHEEIARTVVPIEQPPQEGPGGAYRAPPVHAVIPLQGDASEAIATLNRRAAAIATIASGSTIAFALFAAERSPWPMPATTSTFAAAVGFAAALLVERA